MERKTGRSKSEKKNGQKWVESNYDAKVKAKAENGDVMPKSLALETSDHPISREWSSENLPLILFYLSPPQSQYQGQTVQYLHDQETNELIRSEEGNAIRDFEILPRYISVEVEGWMIEAWRRIDTRITYQDILDRQRTDPGFGGIGLKKLSKNALQNHCYRDCRKILNNWVEYGRRDDPHRTEVETIEGLTYDQIVYNTVLPRCSSFNGRLVKLAFKRRTEDGLFHAVPVQVTPANVLQTTFDIMRFRDAALPKMSPTNFMTFDMDAAWQMSLSLMERARMHGKQHWSKLDRQCLPVTWFDRVAKSKKTVPNPTYDGGCAVCTWTEGRDEGFALKDHSNQSTPRKRIRASSDSNSDEPLFKKQKRIQIANDDLNSDYESEDELVMDEESPRARHDPCATGSHTFLTPTQSLSMSRVGMDCNAGMEEHDGAATHDMLCSETPSTWSSNGVLHFGYQNCASSGGILESPLAKYSNPTYYNSNSPLAPTPIRPAIMRFPQPQWEKLAVSDNASSLSYGLPYPNINEVQGLANYQGATNHENFSFTSSSAEPSSSSTYLGPESAGTSFTSSDEINVLQPTDTGMQRTDNHAALMDNSYQPLAHHPGRMTSQGGRLTDILSSPPPQMMSDFNLNPHTYEPSASYLENSLSGHLSFDGYLPTSSPFTPYCDMMAPDLQWRNQDMNNSDDQLAAQDANQFIEDDYNQLPQVPVLSTPPTSNSLGFLALLSSDPVMPDDYEDLFDPEMLAAQNGTLGFLDYGTAVHENSIDQHSLRVACRTPPLLEY